ncbi:MAG: ATP-dependent RNA helicase HrpA, partial [Verrucomicrobiales bacterium]|nr:ATP-dependent RNA helicase HrpA [Verrucomicrobiales bacterium]
MLAETIPRRKHGLQKVLIGLNDSGVKISYPDDLPVSKRREDIGRALMDHPVVIVCGDTGSGKTTQLPKIALQAGRGMKGKRIGCTQPRRIAATSVAGRVADELGVALGAEVGYQIRFEDRTDREKTSVKFMTDGVLLAETRNDPLLRQYDCLIIDEAHERSLNIDFILGYLKRTLEKRNDLKIVISSATLDAGSFSEFFDDAPVIEVEGRTFPVTDEYQIPHHEREPLSEQIARAVEDLAEYDRLGDTLVFLPGEREIRDAADLLEGRKYRDTLVLPLFARQAGKEQQAVFRPIKSKRRIILATNVAETSLTIPGIRFVIDSGIARISRHDPGSGVQRLQIEPVSKASARQRRGRCGRVSEGVCVRLYSEDDFEERQEFTDPEILRSNLAGVVLQMEHLGLGDPLEFPFVDPPQPKRVSQAYRVLEELGAIRKKGRHVELTGVGHSLARLPLDPQIGRILVAAEEEGCLLEGLIVASALAVQDPRERPREKQEAADSAHGQFRDKRSDFTGWLRWWHAIEESRSKSNNQLRRFCQKNFLNFRRVQEWRNLHRELRDTLREMKWKVPSHKKRLTDPKDTYSEPLHRAILAGIPSHIGMNQGAKKGYKGARNSVFWLFPGSGIFGASPAWVMAFDMVETAKLYARNAAMFDPGWFEKVAPHLCRYRYSNPHWKKDQGAVYGDERVIAFGLPVVDKRPVHYGRIDRKVAREVFLLEALVNQNTRAPIPCLQNNRETLQAAERLEHKMRRLGGLVHPEAVVAFYEEKLPESICTQKDFEKWVSDQPDGTIDFTLEECLLPQLEPIRVDDYPDTITSPDGENDFVVQYLHCPADPADGISAVIPLEELPHLPGWFGEWLVAGCLGEKVSALLRSLRKETRTLLPSNREVVDEFVSAWEGYVPQCGLLEALIDFLQENYDLEISRESFDFDRIPGYLQMRFVVTDGKKIVGEGKDIPALCEELAGKIKGRFSRVSKGKFEKTGLQSWTFGDLPDEVSLDRRTSGFPRLYDAGEGGAGLKLQPSRQCAEVQHDLGLARLYRFVRRDAVARLEKEMFRGADALTRGAQPAKKAPVATGGDDFGSLSAAFGQPAKPQRTIPQKPDKKKAAGGTMTFLTAEQRWMLDNIGSEPARNRMDLFRRVVGGLLESPLGQKEWEEQVGESDSTLFERASEECARLAKLLGVAETIGTLLDSSESGYEESVSDASEHFARLTAPGWLFSGSLTRRLIHFQGLEMRLTRMFGSPPAKDLEKLERYHERSAEIWSGESLCECGACPDAI